MFDVAFDPEIITMTSKTRSSSTLCSLIMDTNRSFTLKFMVCLAATNLMGLANTRISGTAPASGDTAVVDVFVCSVYGSYTNARCYHSRRLPLVMKYHCTKPCVIVR